MFYHRAKMIAVQPTISQVSIMSTLLFPSFFVLGFLNEYFLSPYLPKPRLWNMQIQAELQFQSTYFVEESKQSLEMIKSGLPWTLGQNETLMQRFDVTTRRNDSSYHRDPARSGPNHRDIESARTCYARSSVVSVHSR